MSTDHDFSTFRRNIYRFYRRHGRDLAWRGTKDPYRILVSEVMLQQTQVGRVMEKYEPFVTRFPGFPSLAEATPKEVLEEWQGLGYNRRALALRDLAIRIVGDFSGSLPRDEQALRSLPGIGPYTASAVLVFAFNQPAVMIETNIRRVFLHCFFHDKGSVDDREILPLVRASLDVKNPRRWYNALMDYGSTLASLTANPNRRSRHYQRQSKFEGSVRQVRGRVLKMLVTTGEIRKPDLCSGLELAPGVCEPVLVQLEKEGFVEITGDAVKIKEVLKGQPRRA